MTVPNALTALKCTQCGASLPATRGGYLVCQYCGTGLIWNHPDSGAAPVEQTPTRGMRLAPFTYTDREGTGLEVFRCLVPAGWKFEGGCRWLLDNPGMPAVVAFQFFNPQGAEMFSALPNINLTWNTNPMASLGHPVGSRYFGAEVRPPMGIRQALRELVLPRCRSQVGNLHILAEEPQPDLPRLAKSEAPLVGGSAEGGKVRIRYTLQDKEYDEDIYGVVELYRLPMASMFQPSELLLWYVDFLFSFRAAAGLLDSTMDLFRVMIGSFRLNPQWYAAFKSVAQAMAQQQIQRIHSVGQIGQMLAQTGSQIRQQNLNDWYARQDTYDRISANQSRTIRGTEAYLDPNSQQVMELPAGYEQAWVNNLGEVVLSGSTDFNPNIDSNQHWVPMQPQE
jgi:hypothetical protein